MSEQTWLSRRQLIQGAAGVTAAGALAVSTAEGNDVLKGNINHSVVQWCFAEHWSLEQTCVAAKRLGCKSVELVPPAQWDVLKKHGLQCAVAGSHLFMQGMNNPK